MIPEIGTTEVKFEVHNIMFDMQKGLQAICDMYAGCHTKHVMTYSIDNTDEHMHISIHVPVSIDGDLMQIYKAQLGDLIYCKQATPDSLPVLHIYGVNTAPGEGSELYGE